MFAADKKRISLKISPPVSLNIRQRSVHHYSYTKADINTIIKISDFTQLYFCTVARIIDLQEFCATAFQDGAPEIVYPTGEVIK
jgi:hypothetical protein